MDFSFSYCKINGFSPKKSISGTFTYFLTLKATELKFYCKKECEDLLILYYLYHKKNIKNKGYLLPESQLKVDYDMSKPLCV